jgi:hypothetical protein
LARSLESIPSGREALRLVQDTPPPDDTHDREHMARVCLVLREALAEISPGCAWVPALAQLESRLSLSLRLLSR